MTAPSKKTISYIGLIFVVLVWGFCPILTLKLYKLYSPTARLCFSEFVLLTAYILISGKHIKELNPQYLKIGIPTGIFLALANITQKVGLLYTTPAKYAFLENLSCVTVPVLIFLLTKEKPKFTEVSASFVCLLSAFVLNGISFSDSSWGIGEILCAISGLLYGFNIAGTGIYAKKLNVPLYLAVQTFTAFIISAISTTVLNSCTVTTSSGTKEPIEKIMFSLNLSHMIFVILFTLITSALCWIIRTNSMKHIDACIVAVIMPFSAVVTSVVSVLTGTDTFDIRLLLGGMLGLCAIFLSGYDDIFRKHNKN